VWYMVLKEGVVVGWCDFIKTASKCK